MIFSLRFALSLFVAFNFLGCVWKPIAADPPKDPYVKVGQGFSVRIVPVARTVDVYVTAQEATPIDFGDLHVFADVQIGRKSWFIVPKKMRDRFVLAIPSAVPPRSKAELKILLKTKDKEEILKFELPETS